MSSGNKGNRMKAMYNIVMPKSGGTHETRNAENVNQERLNENFSTLSKEIVKLWDSSENGFDSLAARLTSDEEVFITADDAEDIAVYEIKNSAVIAALPTEILTAVSRVYETKSDASDKLDAAKNYTDSELVDYSTTSQTADMISQSVAHKVGDDEIISKINQSAEQIEIQANKVDLSGYVTFTNLSTPGQTTIDGGNLTTGTISADRIAAGSLSIGKLDTATQNTINTAASNASTALSDAAAAQSTANGANSQEQLIFISRTSGTTTQSGTTTWVTDATGNQNTWTIKRPTYNSSYPVLFVATQRKNVAGTVTCTTPQIDNTTTVIDGGHITTGTIDASVVSVTNLNASNITSGSLSANYIQGGMMTVGGLNNTNGYIRILDSTGNYAGGVGASGITLQGEEPYSGLSHVIYNAIFPYANSLRDQTTQKQLINVDVQIPSATDEYAKYYIQGYDNGTQVSRVEFSSYPYNNGAYLILQGPNGLIRLNSDGTYAGDLTINYGGNLTIKGGVLDVVDRRCYATLSSAGWYRVMKLTGSDIYEAEGAGGFIVDFNIVRNVDTANNEAHKISLMATWGNIKFINEQSVSNTLGITKIRTTNSGSNLYVDVYYELLTTNTVTVAFNVTCRGGDESKFNSQPFTSVAASPSGETVLTEYTFAVNSESRSFYAGSFYGSSDEEVISQVCEAVRTKYPTDFGKYDNTPFPISFFRQGAWEYVGTGWIRNSEVYLSVGSFGAGRYSLAYQASSGATPTVKTVTLS